MVKVSIIVPVYNVKNYLDRCLNSLIHQTLKEIEILVVNDGSTDGSEKIIESYQKKDKRIISLKKKNGGLSDARNYALPHVKGEYVGFVDSDDYIEEEMYELLYKKAKEEKADLVECDFSWDYESGKVIVDQSNIVDNPFVDIRVVAWNKLYRMDIIKKHHLEFPKGLRYEDISFCYQYLPYVKKLSSVDKVMYHYIQRGDSIANTQNPKVRELYDILTGVLDYYKKNGFYETYQKELEYVFIRYIFGRNFYRITSLKDKKLRKQFLEEGYSLLEENFPNWKQNFYLKKKKGKKNFYYRHMNKTIYHISATLFHLFGNVIIDH